jgi:hypothetical protein
MLLGYGYMKYDVAETAGMDDAFARLGNPGMVGLLRVAFDEQFRDQFGRVSTIIASTSHVQEVVRRMDSGLNPWPTDPHVFPDVSAP